MSVSKYKYNIIRILIIIREGKGREGRVREWKGGGMQERRVEGSGGEGRGREVRKAKD